MQVGETKENTPEPTRPGGDARRQDDLPLPHTHTRTCSLDMGQAYATMLSIEPAKDPRASLPQTMSFHPSVILRVLRMKWHCPRPPSFFPRSFCRCFCRRCCKS